MFWLINLYIAHCNFVELNWCLHYSGSILIFPAWFPDSCLLAPSKENKINAGEHITFYCHHRNTLRYKAIWRQLSSQQQKLPPPPPGGCPPPAQPGLPQHLPGSRLGHQLPPEQMHWQVTSSDSILSHRIYKIQAKTSRPSTLLFIKGLALWRRTGMGWISVQACTPKLFIFNVRE